MNEAGGRDDPIEDALLRSAICAGAALVAIVVALVAGSLRPQSDFVMRAHGPVAGAPVKLSSLLDLHPARAPIIARSDALRIGGAPDPSLGARTSDSSVLVEVHVPSRACKRLIHALGGVCGGTDPTRARSASVGSFEARSLGAPLSLQAWTGTSSSLSLTQATLRSQRDHSSAWTMQEAGGEGRVVVTCSHDVPIVLAAGERRLQSDCSTASTTYRRRVSDPGLPAVALYLNGISRLEAVADAERVDAQVGAGQLRVEDSSVTLGNGGISEVHLAGSSEHPVHLHLIDSTIADLSQLVLTSRAAQVSVDDEAKNPSYLDRYSTFFYSIFALLGAALFAALIDWAVKQRSADH